MALGDDLSPPNVAKAILVIHSILEFHYSPGPLHLVVFLLFFLQHHPSIPGSQLAITAHDKWTRPPYFWSGRHQDPGPGSTRRPRRLREMVLPALPTATAEPRQQQ